jgi:putative ABC transport system substrate-binding protein
MMRRPDFITLLGAAAVWPLEARAQQPAMPVVGWMSGRSPEDSIHLFAAFRDGLRETGFVEGQNISIEYRWALGQYDRLPALASDLVRLGVTVLVGVGGDVSAIAAKQATKTIPIVFGMGGDPIKAGLVNSFKKAGVLDPSAFAESGGPSIAERMAVCGVWFKPADNRRVSQLGAMGGWDHAVPAAA